MELRRARARLRKAALACRRNKDSMSGSKTNARSVA
jgi:hypothetical protein